MFTTIQEGLKALQKQQLSDIPKEELYVPLQGRRTTFENESPFDLQEEVNPFLTFTPKQDEKDEKNIRPEHSKKVLLLQGETGSGKSVFCQNVVRHLWEKYQAEKPIPLFISLPRLENSDKAIEEKLEKTGFSAYQIATLKKY